MDSKYILHSVINHLVCYFAQSGGFYTQCMILHTVFDVTVHDILHCFVAKSILSCILGIKSFNHTECLCKINDKYEVCVTGTYTFSMSVCKPLLSMTVNHDQSRHCCAAKKIAMA